MKPSDVLLDLNDLWGRIVPGIFVLGDICLGVTLVHPVDTIRIVSFLTQHTFLLSLLLGLGCFFAHVLGELVLYPVFRLRWRLPRKKPIEVLRDIDVTKNRQVISLYESRFTKESLNATNSSLPSFCKSVLLHECPQAYEQARKIEARINLKGGMILPMFALGVLAVFGKMWLLSALAWVLLLIFISGFIKAPRVEHAFLFRAYYNCSCCEDTKELDGGIT